MLGVKDSLLEELIQEQLGSVVFVRDYLQLDFGDARFTALTWPLVTIGETTLSFGEPGYRDALCGFIDHEVTAAAESSDRDLVIRFGLGEIRINPEASDLQGPETAQLHVYDPMSQETSLMVCRPGEDTFVGRAWD